MNLSKANSFLWKTKKKMRKKYNFWPLKNRKQNIFETFKLLAFPIFHYKNISYFHYGGYKSLSHTTHHLQIIAAEGENQAAHSLKEASDTINKSATALQLRYLQTLNTISAEKNSTIIFPLPIQMMNRLMVKKKKKNKHINGKRAICGSEMSRSTSSSGGSSGGSSGHGGANGGGSGGEEKGGKDGNKKNIENTPKNNDKRSSYNNIGSIEYKENFIMSNTNDNINNINNSKNNINKNYKINDVVNNNNFNKNNNNNNNKKNSNNNNNNTNNNNNNNNNNDNNGNNKKTPNLDCFSKAGIFNDNIELNVKNKFK